MTNHLVQLQEMSKVFYTDKLATRVLNEIDLTIEDGNYLSITGPSGCGKSTLLSILGLLDTSSSGQYFLAGHDVAALNRNERARIRNKEIGFVFQSFNLISDLSIEENVGLPLSYRADIKSSEISAMVALALEKVDMTHRTKHFPAQLSGGQQQRVAIARAIAGNPSLVLADEPTGNLDSKNADIVMEIFDELNAAGTTICMVTHDPRSSQRAERSIHLFDGKIASDQQEENRMAHC